MNDAIVAEEVADKIAEGEEVEQKKQQYNNFWMNSLQWMYTS